MAAPASPYPVTPPQQLILRTIERWLRTHGYAPTVRDIQRVLSYGSPATVWWHLRNMRDAGLIDWVDGQVRTIHLTREGTEALTPETELPS